jgi:hypothetical protein
MMMNAQKAYPSQNSHGTIIQTLDVLDFSSVDLSSLERLQRRHRLRLRASAGKQGIDPIQAVIDASALLRERALSKRTPYTHYSNRTIVIIPFLGSDRPNGNSLLANRMHYLRACFWSIFHEFPHIVAAVKDLNDELVKDLAIELPFMEVLLIEALPKSAALYVAAVQQAKARLKDGRWNFDYIYFSDPEQVAD